MSAQSGRFVFVAGSRRRNLLATALSLRARGLFRVVFMASPLVKRDKLFVAIVNAHYLRNALDG